MALLALVTSLGTEESDENVMILPVEGFLKIIHNCHDSLWVWEVLIIEDGID